MGTAFGEINKNVYSRRHRRDECVCACESVCVCVDVPLVDPGEKKWLLLSPLCYVTLQSNYRVCALFRGCLIMLFGLCRALGCHRMCVYVFVCVCVCVVGEKTLIVEEVLMVQQLSGRERGREGDREERKKQGRVFCVSLSANVSLPLPTWMMARKRSS